MTTIGKRAVMSLALGSLMTVVVVSGALAIHARPTTGTPFRVPFVPAYKACTTANTKHVAPLAFGACTPPPMTSATLTQGNLSDVGSGFGNLRVFCTNGQLPSCSAAGSQLDIAVTASLTDVRCAVGGIPGCTAIGFDYTGMVAGESVMRITDHSSIIECPTGSGSVADGCVTATVTNFAFGVPISCVADTNATGGNCSLGSTINTLAPGTVKESQRAVIEILNLHVNDAGPDGSIDDGVNPPGDLFGCPPDCATGDETVYQNQGVFLP